MYVGGNKWATILVKRKNALDEMGFRTNTFEEVKRIRGFLDKRTTYDKHNVMDTEIEQGNHFFLCDYSQIGELYKEWDEYDCALAIDRKLYTVTHWDNVMELNEHFEIYLRKVGDQGDKIEMLISGEQPG